MKVPHGGDIWRIARKGGFDPAEILDFSASVVPLGPSSLALDSIRDSFSLLSAYPDPCSTSFVSALSGHLSVSKENIAVGNGSIELIYLLPRLLKPKRALIVEPAFGEYARSLELAGCEVEGFQCREEDGFALNLDELIERLNSAPAIDILYMANPANPTGLLTPHGEMERIVKICEERGTTFVVDEAFCDFCEGSSVKSLIEKTNSLVVFRSMTKFFSLAGLRLGAILGTKDLIDSVIEQRVPWSINTLALAAGLASLKDTGYMREVRGWFEEESEFMAKELSSIGGLSLFPQARTFLCSKLTQAQSLPRS